MKTRFSKRPARLQVTAAMALIFTGSVSGAKESTPPYLSIVADGQESYVDAQDYAFDDDDGDTYANDADWTKPAAASTGKIEVFRERYENGNVKIEREVTLDAEGNYVNHGAWKMWDQSGLLVADGQYDLGKRVGNWTRMLGRGSAPALNQPPFNRFKAPFVSQVNFTNGKMDGEWIIIDVEQRKCSQISLKNGVRDGLAITWLPSGAMMRQIRYEQGVPVGDVVEINATSGEPEQVASYLDGRRVAKNTTHFGRGQQTKTEEWYLAPKTVQTAADNFATTTFAQYGSEGEAMRHGISRAWYPNGQLQWEGQYEYGERAGHFKYWHTNGQLAAEGKYKHDQFDGPWLWWHENGQKAITGKYEEGRLVGEWRWWDELGKLSDRRYYDGSESVSRQELEPPPELGLAPAGGPLR